MKLVKLNKLVGNIQALNEPRAFLGVNNQEKGKVESSHVRQREKVSQGTRALPNFKPSRDVE